jgi:hypothetical protein
MNIRQKESNSEGVLKRQEWVKYFMKKSEKGNEIVGKVESSKSIYSMFSDTICSL